MIETTEVTKKMRAKATKEKSEHLLTLDETNHYGAEDFWIPLRCFWIPLRYAKRNDGCVGVGLAVFGGLR